MRSSHPRSQHVGTLMPRNSLRRAYGRDKRSEHHHGFVHGPGRSVEHRQPQRISLTPEIHRPCVHVGRHQFGLPSTADEPGMPNRWGAIHECDHAARHAARGERLSLTNVGRTWASRMATAALLVPDSSCAIHRCVIARCHASPLPYLRAISSGAGTPISSK